jgi:hypothetical protein
MIRLSRFPQGRLYAALYNDGTGSSIPGDIKGDVLGMVGILDNGQDSTGVLYRRSLPCINCNLPGEYGTSARNLQNVQLNELTRSPFMWIRY